MTSGDTSFLTAGQEILLVNASVHSGVHTIDAVTSLTTFTYSSILTATVTAATLIGDTVQVGVTLSDEQMRNLTFATSEIALHGIVLNMSPGPQLA
jgi:hypothetical protein